LCATKYEGYWVTLAPSRCRRLRRTRTAFLRPPSPTTFAAGSSSRALCLSFRVCRASARPLPHGSGHLPWGSSPPSRHQLVESLMRASHFPHRSALDVSHVLDGFLLRQPCGLISSRSHVRGSLSRVFPSSTAARARRPPLPSCRYRKLPTRDRSRAPETYDRLQGLAPCPSPSCAVGV
jgi:hypothetical protein